MSTRTLLMMLLCMTQTFGFEAKQRASSKGGKDKMNPVTFSISLNKHVFLRGEGITPELQVINRSPNPVAIPVPTDPSGHQPVYRLRFPSGRIRTFDPSMGTATEAKQLSIDLPAESAWEGRLLLSLQVPLDQVGRYELSATLGWQGLSVFSNRLIFDILAPNYSGRALERSLLVDGGERYSAIGYQPTSTNNIYFAYDFVPSIQGGLMKERIGPVVELPPNEIKLYNMIRQDNSPYFIAGVQGGRVVVMDLYPDIKPLWIDGAINVIAMLPAIVTYEGLNLFLVRKNAGNTELAFAFARPLDQPKADSALRTIATLPAGFVAADATFELGVDKPRMVVASVGNVGTNVQVQVLFADQKGSIKAKTEYAVPGLAAVGPVAVSVGPKEQIRIGFVAHSSANAKDMFLVDVRTEKGGLSGPMSTSTTPLHFDNPPKEIQIRYALDETGTPARALLARMADGQAFMIQEHHPIRKLSFTIPPDSTTALVLDKNHNWNVAVFTQTGVQLNYVPPSMP